MNVKTYYTPQIWDEQLPNEFVKSCNDSTKPISVVGNGGSLELLTDKQIEQINQTRLFRCNWAFNDPSNIKKEYAIYFSQAFGGNEEEKFTKKARTTLLEGKWKYYRFQNEILYNFHPMCTLVDEKKYCVWPTSGIQMLMVAAFQIQAPVIYIAGIDMYTYKKPRGKLTKEQEIQYLKNHGKKFSSSPDNSCGITHEKNNLTFVDPTYWTNKIKKDKFTYHYIECDYLMLMITFANLQLRECKTVFFKCNILEQIYNITQKHLDIISDYYNLRDITNPKSQITCYNMWRLVNKTMKSIIYD